MSPPPARAPSLLGAAERLAHVLDAENAALRALDVNAALAVLDAKRAAMAELETAMRAAPPGPATPLRAAAIRLAEAAADNKRLLERAIGVQSDVIALLARAIPTPHAAQPYGRATVRPTTASPFSLRAQA